MKVVLEVTKETGEAHAAQGDVDHALLEGEEEEEVLDSVVVRGSLRDEVEMTRGDSVVILLSPLVDT